MANDIPYPLQSVDSISKHHWFFLLTISTYNHVGHNDLLSTFQKTCGTKGVRKNS